ncbi:Piso0_001974 [Millerozyma farinosa CBS 7064]|uniref:Piso0_001974 protein n=1 Tax=Pichia sorbitophila (strain ATCC MYA-4447 / BCRC 22081 / CBS 7064 / NBRC 10061 / NRRL Y-12695) TaxID=559304 RepID=G8YBC6_PICSO|nr:Piso0_001974 [Millerozyma farinosa CBS 7064]
MIDDQASAKAFTPEKDRKSFTDNNNGRNAPTKAKRKRGRPRRSPRIMRKNSTDYNHDPLASAGLLNKIYKGKKPSISKPSESYALTKKRAIEKQKPVYVDTERLVIGNHGERLPRVNTIDFLKFLVNSFTPRILGTKWINEEAMHHDFRNYIIFHLNYLSDLHSDIHDVSSKIKDIQKRKNEMRNKIFELKAQHSILGANIVKNRDYYNEERHTFRARMQTIEEMCNISEGLKQSNMNPITNEVEALSSSTSAENELIGLGKIINPATGLCSKLIAVNERLSNINQHLN